MRAATRSKDGSHFSRWLPTLERLEAREVPAVTAALSQIATWSDIGPNVTTNTQVRNIGANNEGIGAVQALAFHPTNPNILFAGSPNGGIWRTENAQAAVPLWVPIADQVASLSIADIAIDPDNPNRLVAAVGATADGWQPEGGPQNRLRGDLIGLVYTENALAPTPTWRFLNNNLAGKNVVNVFIRTGYILAATDQGTFRSADNGATFRNIYPVTVDNGQSFNTTQFNQGVYDMAENPRLRDQFYLATRPGAGRATNEVWRTDDGGQTWGRITDPVLMQLNARTVNVQLTVRDVGASDNQVYVAVANNFPVGSELSLPGFGVPYAWNQRLGTLTSVCWSPNQGGVWTQMDAPRQLTDPDPLDRGARDPDGVANGVAVKNVGGGADINGGVISISSRFAHRLRTGDRVFVRGLFEWEPTTPPDPEFGGFFTITVVDAFTFTLDGVTLDWPGINSLQGYWQRVVGANPGERGEFLQIATSNLLGNERVLLGGDFKNMKFEDFTDNGGEPGLSGPGFPIQNPYPGLNNIYPGLDDNTDPISFTGSLWTGNRLTTPFGVGFSGSWAQLTDGGTNLNQDDITSPGGDTREMVVQTDGLGNRFLWVGTGTGIYRRQLNANGAGAFDWTSANGNLAVGQFWSASYDSLNNVVAGATQDTGAVESGPNSNTYNAYTPTAQRNALTDQEYAYSTAIDNTSVAGQSVRYTASSNFFNVRRRVFTAGNVPVVGGNTTLNFANALTTNAPLSGITIQDQNLFQDPSARIVLGLNANDRSRGVYGLTNVYEDADPNGVTGFIVNNVTPPDMNGRVSAMSYGGKRAGVNFNQVLAVGTNTGQLWLRSEFGITFNQISPGGATGGAITDIDFDPDNYQHMFVVQGGRVFETTNAVAAVPVWVEVSAGSGGVAGLVGAADPLTGLPTGGSLTTEIRTVALFDPNPGTANVGTTGDVVLLAGGRGGVFRRTLSVCGTATIWSEYGNGLPNTYVTDLQIDSTGTRLTAGTFGRGVWTVPNVQPTLGGLLFLDVVGDAGNNSITVQADPNDPNAVLVLDGTTLVGRFLFGQFDSIRISALGGADTVRIGNGTSTQFVNYPIIANPGGDVGDSLIIDASGATANVQATVDPTFIGRGAGDTIFSGCGSVTYIGLNQGTLHLLTGSGNDLIAFTAGTFPPVSAVYTGAGDDFVLVDGNSSGVLQLNDTTGTDTLVVNVPANTTAVVDSFNRSLNFGSRQMRYPATYESVVLHGNPGSTVNWFGTNQNDTVFLAQDTSLPGGSQLFTSTGAPGSAQNIRFRGMSQITLNTAGAADLVVVDSNATAAGGSAKFIDYTVLANMGGDAADRIAVNDSSTPTGTLATVFASSVGAGPGNNLFNPGGALYFTGLSGTGRLDLDTGSAGDAIVVDTSAPLDLVYNGNGGGNSALFVGTGGNDSFAVNGGFLQANAVRAFTANVGLFGVSGQGGSDLLGANGTAGNDTLVVNQSSLQSGLVAGLPVWVQYDSLEWVNVDAGGGSNTLLWNDTSNTSYGTPTAPTSGLTFAPTGAASGTIRTAGGAGTLATFSQVNAEFNMNGDPFGTNTRDVIAVLGVSTAGLATDGELTSANGSDTILPTADGVSITNAALGQLRRVTFAAVPNNTASSFSTVYVKGGNEGGVGDAFAASPTLRTNLLLDGGDPSAAPGDTLTITTNGPASTASVNDPSLGPPHTRVTNRSDRASVGHLNFEGVTANTTDPSNPGGPPVPSFGSVKADLFAVGSSGGVTATVQVYNLDGSLRFAVAPFGDFTGAVRVAVGDVTGDGKSDVVAAAGPGGGPVVNVYDGQTGALVRAFFAYDPGFTGGVTVAVGNLNTDRFADVITGAGAGGGPHVKAFDGATNGELASFFAYSPTFINGVNVAAGDVDGDGISDFITGAGAGGGPHVKVFNGTNLAEIHSFFAFEPAFTGGVNVAAGDMSGDGRADIFVGAGAGGGPLVKVFDAVSLGLRQAFFVNDPNVTGAPPVAVSGGVAVAAGDFDNDGLADMLTGRGQGSRPFAQVFKLTAAPTLLLAVNTFGDLYSNGISVGV